jgi:hypothetical protein
LYSARSSRRSAGGGSRETPYGSQSPPGRVNRRAIYCPATLEQKVSDGMLLRAEWRLESSIFPDGHARNSEEGAEYRDSGRHLVVWRQGGRLVDRHARLDHVTVPVHRKETLPRATHKWCRGCVAESIGSSVNQSNWQGRPRPRAASYRCVGSGRQQVWDRHS